MNDEMLQQLESMKTTLVAELRSLEVQLEQLQHKAKEKRQKIAAIEVLLPSAAADPDFVEDAVEDYMKELFTPVRAYWRPILQTLVDFGGGGRREKVIETVGERMKNRLTHADYGKLPKSGHTRWSNRVAWQASNMRADGLIKNDSPRGIWEITGAGRKWLDDNKD